MEKKKYIIAPKRTGEPAPPDWQERIAAMPGVVVLGCTRTQAQFLADPGTAGKVGNEFGDCCTIEEVAERRPT